MTRAILIAAISAGVLTNGAPCAAQNAETRTQNPEHRTENPRPATLRGRVVADDTGEPIVNARVRIAAAGASVLVVTDSSGAFTAAPSAGALTITASKSGYITRTITAADVPRPMEVRLERAAVISGHVVDRMGEPVVGAMLLAEAAPSAGARRTIARTATDDRGEFRLAGIAAGQMVVSVVTVSATAVAETTGAVAMYSPRTTRTYFPSVASAADAEVIVLHPGDERPAVDFVVAMDETGFGIVQFAGRVTQSAGPVAGANGAIRGRVNAEGRPLAGAAVQLIGRGSPVPLRGTRSDAQGAYEFAAVPAGRFQVSARKPGYAPARPSDAVLPSEPSFGAGPAVDLQADETRDDADIELVRLGTVSGVVADELGEPLQGASVQLLQVRYDRGRRRLAASATARLTDDRGAYRIFDVPPGQYVVTASIGGVAGAELAGYARSYFPGSDDPSAAQFLSIGASQDLTGIDFALQAARTARIAGTILGSSGGPAASGTVQLRPDPGAGAIAALPIGAKTAGDGSFEFPNVAPGRYLIYVDHGRSHPSTEGDFAVVPVAADGSDVTGLTIQVAPGSSVAGRIRFDSADATHRPPFGAIEISPVPIDPDLAPSNVANADIRADGSFTMQGLRGVRRIEATRLPPGWMLREVRVSGIDATDRPLAFGRREQSLPDVEVVLTDRLDDLAGSVAGENEQPAAGAHVVVFPTERDRRYAGSRFVRDASTGVDGAFDIAGFPPGNYYVAVAGRPPLDGDDAWQDPEFLESLVPGATVVTFGEGEKQTVRMKTAGR